jgi:hypothetical protein
MVSKHKVRAGVFGGKCSRFPALLDGSFFLPEFDVVDTVPVCHAVEQDTRPSCLQRVVNDADRKFNLPKCRYRCTCYWMLSVATTRFVAGAFDQFCGCGEEFDVHRSTALEDGPQSAATDVASTCLSKMARKGAVESVKVVRLSQFTERSFVGLFYSPTRRPVLSQRMEREPDSSGIVSSILSRNRRQRLLHRGPSRLRVHGRRRVRNALEKHLCFAGKRVQSQMTTT